MDQRYNSSYGITVTLVDTTSSDGNPDLFHNFKKEFIG